jgi:hypothetical protein
LRAFEVWNLNGTQKPEWSLRGGTPGLSHGMKWSSAN